MYWSWMYWAWREQCIHDMDVYGVTFMAWYAHVNHGHAGHGLHCTGIHSTDSPGMYVQKTFVHKPKINLWCRLRNVFIFIFCRWIILCGFMYADKSWKERLSINTAFNPFLILGAIWLLIQFWNLQNNLHQFCSCWDSNYRLALHENYHLSPNTF